MLHHSTMTDDTRGTIRICQISDLHLPLEKAIPVHRLLGKRSLGYANLRLIRSRTHDLAPFERLLDHMVESQPDLVLVTGDLTSLAFAFEFARVDRVLDRAGLSPTNTLVIPGNHDRYTFGADLTSAFEQGMARWLPPDFERKRDYPLVKVVGPVVVYALDTAVWRGPIRAAGRIGSTQVHRLGELLETHRAAGLWPVVAMHHPPFRLKKAGLRHYRTGLEGLTALEQTLRPHPATILHGHLHYLSRRRIGSWDVVGAPSATNNAGFESAQLAYHAYEFDKTGLLSARAVRFWPGRDTPLEIADLPEEALIG